MSDLISRQAVMEMLINISLSCTPIPMVEAKIGLREIPTAYNVDKVIEQIKNIGTQFCTNAHCNTECSDCDHGVMMKSVINAVKEGGVNEKMTDWMAIQFPKILEVFKEVGCL